MEVLVSKTVVEDIRGAAMRQHRGAAEKVLCQDKSTNEKADYSDVTCEHRWSGYSAPRL